MCTSLPGQAQLVRKLLAFFPDLSNPVISAIANVPRHVFCRDSSPEDISHAYDDRTIEISGSEGYTSSLSMPSCVAMMLDALAVAPGQRVLEVGADRVMRRRCSQSRTEDDALVTTVEVDPVLAEKARDNLRFIGKAGVNVLEADASLCPPELADTQFDRVLFSTGVSVPPAWIVRSLSSEGMMVFPLDALIDSSGIP